MAKIGRPRLAVDPAVIRTDAERAFKDAVTRAGARRGMTTAAYVRFALAEQMKRDRAERKRIA